MIFRDPVCCCIFDVPKYIVAKHEIFQERDAAMDTACGRSPGCQMASWPARDHRKLVLEDRPTCDLEFAQPVFPVPGVISESESTSKIVCVRSVPALKGPGCREPAHARESDLTFRSARCRRSHGEGLPGGDLTDHPPGGARFQKEPAHRSPPRSWRFLASPPCLSSSFGPSRMSSVRLV